MPKATFIAQPDPCAVFGRVFPFNVPVDVSDLDPAYIDALAGNPTFTMDYSAEQAVASAAQAKAAAAAKKAADAAAKADAIAAAQAEADAQAALDAAAQAQAAAVDPVP